MQRYFIPENNWVNNEIMITEDDAHHIIRVMRYKVNDQIICNHENGKAYVAIIDRIEGQLVYAKKLHEITMERELPIDVIILQGLPKGNKLEFITQKGTELGAHSFYLYEADRSITKWDAKKISQRLIRYKKIAKEASEQCHRNQVPEIEFVGSLKNFLQSNPLNNTVKIFAYEEMANSDTFSSFAEILNDINTGETVLICIGPEGGFSDEEVESLYSHDFQPVRLGKRILRTETAPLYALASISYHFEEMNSENETH